MCTVNVELDADGVAVTVVVYEPGDVPLSRSVAWPGTVTEVGDIDAVTDCGALVASPAEPCHPPDADSVIVTVAVAPDLTVTDCGDALTA
ncbi:MAG TPA: hypothetical protein VKJ07_14190 [Mycobacteriales bacterium]|nr:hypothetical protein [Mycobacteriales bacterium]